jgi:hypothetical protein
MRLLILAAVICFVIALLGAVDVFSGVNVTAWTIGGFLAWSLDAALGGYPIAIPTRRPPE